MKKKRKEPQPPKEKRFAAAPFASLKGVRLSREEPAPAPPSPPARPVPEEKDDEDLFLRAMGGVKPLKAPAGPSGQVSGEAPGPTPVTPMPRKIEEEERRVFLDALDRLQLDVTFNDDLPAASVQRPLPVNRLRQLRRGAIRIDYELDLHGLTREEAVDALALFIASAARLRQKAVLVITGKGNNSPGEPVLQGAVTAWLREKGGELVAEFFPAPQNLGGGGAVVVFLREPARTATGEEGEKKGQ